MNHGADTPLARRAHPNLLVVGVTKAGTTSLFSYLTQHPEVCGSTVKETEYFSPLLYPDGEIEPWPVYERYFASCRDARFVVEATANYWYGGERVWDAIDARLADARFVLSLRDPVPRFWSEFNYMKGKRLLPDHWTPEHFLDRCIEAHETGRAFTRESRHVRTLATGFYADHLPGWMERFGGRTRIVFFEDLASSPRAVVEELFAWLDLPTDAAAGVDLTERNPTTAHRSALLQRAAFAGARSAERVFRRRPEIKERAARAYYRLNRGDSMTDAIPEAVRTELTRRYDESNRALAELLRAHGYARLPAWLSP